MLGNTKFRPSFIEDAIYDMMDDYIAGSDIYNEGLVSAVTDFLTNYNRNIEWNLAGSEWPNCSGGACHVSWIESGHLHSIGFDYIKEGYVNDR